MTGPVWSDYQSSGGNYSSFMFGKKIIVFDGSHYLKGQKEARTYYGLQIVRSQDQQRIYDSNNNNNVSLIVSGARLSSRKISNYGTFEELKINMDITHCLSSIQFRSSFTKLHNFVIEECLFFVSATVCWCRCPPKQAQTDSKVVIVSDIVGKNWLCQRP